MWVTERGGPLRTGEIEGRFAAHHDGWAWAPTCPLLEVFSLANSNAYEATRYHPAERVA